MYIGLYKTPNKALFCLVLSCLKRYCDINSLRKHSFLLALRRWKRFARRKRPQRRRARRNGCFRRLRHQWDRDYQYSLVFLVLRFTRVTTRLTKVESMENFKKAFAKIAFVRPHPLLEFVWHKGRIYELSWATVD